MRTVIDTGKTLISSPVVQGVVSSLITTLFVRRGENIKVMEALKAKEFEKRNGITQEKMAVFRGYTIYCLM